MRGPEAIIEDDNSAYSKQLGLKTLKLRLLGTIGWPDRLYLARGSRILFVEYKAPGEVPGPHQKHIHEELREFGFHVEVIDNIEKGRKLLRGFSEKSRKEK